MKKLSIYWMLCLFILAFTACNNDDDPINPGEETPDAWWTPFEDGTQSEEAYLIPPGPDYVPQGKYNNNLNIVYYIPSDSDTIPEWHKRLSGIVKYLQEYYKQQMSLNGLGEKTFRLVLNKQNPAYVKIIYIKSTKISSEQCKDENGSSLAKSDILDWFIAHPEEKAGSHFLIFLPGESAGFFHGSYADWIDGSPLGMCMVASDNLGYNIRNFFRGNLENGAIGGILHELGHAFFLPHDSQKATQAPKVSLMNDGNWYYTPGNEHNVFLTRLDAMWLNQIQPFNEEENNYTERPLFQLKGRELSADRNNIYFKLCFTTSFEVEGVGFYNDPWSHTDRSKDENIWEYTEYDAVSYYVCADEQFSDKGSFVRNGENYEVSVVMPWEDLNGKYKLPFADYSNVQAEIRYRILFKGGQSIPAPSSGPKGGDYYRSYYQIHNEMPDIAARYLDRSAWTATTAMGTPALGLTEGTSVECMFMSHTGAVTVDMKEVKKIRALFLQPGKNAMRMTCIKIEGSVDGVEYKDLLSKYYMSDDGIDSYEALLPGGDTEVRYLRLTSLQGKNAMASTFDEISVFPSYE